MVSRHGTFLSLLVLALFLALPNTAQARKKFGAGVMFGDPTGLSFKYGLNSRNAIDFGLAWSGKVDIHMHADYLWFRDNLFVIDGEGFDAYWGIGARIRELDEDEWKKRDDDETKIGARGPAGLRWVASSIPLEVFLEIALIFDVVPGTDGSIDGGIGVRYFF